MSNNQLFFSLVGVLIALFTFMKYYLDAKIDPVKQQVDKAIDYLILHEGKISRLEERTK